MLRALPKQGNDYDGSSSSPITPMRTAGTGGPVVSFADFLDETGGDDISLHDDKLSNHESISIPIPIQNIQLQTESDS